MLNWIRRWWLSMDPVVGDTASDGGTLIPEACPVGLSPALSHVAQARGLTPAEITEQLAPCLAPDDAIRLRALRALLLSGHDLEAASVQTVDGNSLSISGRGDSSACGDAAESGGAADSAAHPADAAAEHGTPHSEAAIRHASHLLYCEVYNFDTWLDGLRGVTHPAELVELDSMDEAALGEGCKRVAALYWEVHRGSTHPPTAGWLQDGRVWGALEPAHRESLADPHNSNRCRYRCPGLARPSRFLRAAQQAAAHETPPKNVGSTMTDAEAMRNDSGWGALDLLCGSLRVADDLARPSSMDAAALTELQPEGVRLGRRLHLIVRPWVEISPWTELRGLIVDRRLAALSQYCTAEHYPELWALRGAMGPAAIQFVLAELGPAMPMPHAVVDLIWSAADGGVSRDRT